MGLQDRLKVGSEQQQQGNSYEDSRAPDRARARNAAAAARGRRAAPIRTPS